MSGNNTVINVLKAFDGEYGNYSVEYLMNTVEFKEEGFRIIDCPVCGRKMMDMWWICSGCGWEYDYSDDDNEFSSCNGATLGEYKNVYRILRDAYERIKSGERVKFYVITCYPSEFSWSNVSNSQATYGVFDSVEACRKALSENQSDMYKGIYDLAVVECIDMKSNISEIACFVWNEEKQGFIETDKKADWTHGWINLV